MRKTNLTKPSYWWLKTLIIIAVVVIAYLLITKQYSILIISAICGIGGYVIYRVAKSKLENRGKIVKLATEDKTFRQVVKQAETFEFDIRKIPTNELVEELNRRGEIR